MSINDRLRSLLGGGNVKSPLTGNIYSYNYYNTNKPVDESVGDLLKPMSKEEQDNQTKNNEEIAEKIYQDALKNHGNWWEYAKRYKDMKFVADLIVSNITETEKYQDMIKMNTVIIDKLNEKILAGLR
jgi:hypothetical protein